MACLTEGLPLGVPCGVPCLVLCPLGPGSTFLSSALCATQLSGAHLFEIPHGGLTYTIAACCRLLSCSTHVFKEIGVTILAAFPYYHLKYVVLPEKNCNYIILGRIVR